MSTQHSINTLHLATEERRPDLASAESAAEAFLRALGVDTDSADMASSPRRMAAAYSELLSAPEFEPTTFKNDRAYSGLVIARSVPVQSICEHHFLPFTGTAHIGYVPGERILGLSKLARLAEMFARRPQVQERLTQQIADWLVDNLAPRSVGVVIDAEHTCMTLRGVRATGSTTRTSVFTGDLLENPTGFLVQLPS
ncbi:MAG: GTP cyclohydrolase I [Propionibacteriales bacterium]|nr:GTP cyclohydrolase I [Propionibacteriales bacterium]